MENTKKISQKSKVESQKTQVENQETNSQALVKVDVIEQFCAVSEQARVVNEQVETLRPQAASETSTLLGGKKKSLN